MRGNDRLLSILSALGNERDLTLSEVADRVQLPRPTALRFLRSLENDGWVFRGADNRYSLGPAVLSLASQYLWTDDLVVTASAEMIRLRDELGETISLSRLVGDRRVCVQEFPSTASLRLILHLGGFGPLHAGASGLVLMAALGTDEFEAYLDRPKEQLTDRTVTDADGLRAIREQVRDHGYIVTRGQRTPGGVAVAVPVRDPGAPRETSALGLYAPEARWTADNEKYWVESLIEAGRAIEASTSLRPTTSRRATRR